jgi:hypothetical protein
LEFGLSRDEIKQVADTTLADPRATGLTLLNDLEKRIKDKGESASAFTHHFKTRAGSFMPGALAVLGLEGEE